MRQMSRDRRRLRAVEDQRVPLREHRSCIRGSKATRYNAFNLHPWQFLDIDTQDGARSRSSDAMNTRCRCCSASLRAAPLPVAARAGRPRQGAARRLPHGGDGLRSAGGVRPVLELRQPRDLRAAVSATTSSRGRTRSCPNTTAALPEGNKDGTEWTIRVKPGIHFTDDPAFKGKKRELTAADYVYTFKRTLDPAMRSPPSSSSTASIAGMDKVLAKAKETGQVRLRRAGRGPAGRRQATR